MANTELQKCSDSGLGHLNSICSFTGFFEALLRAVGLLRSINLCVCVPLFFVPLTVVQRNCQLSSKSPGQLAQKLRHRLREDAAPASGGRGSRSVALWSCETFSSLCWESGGRSPAPGYSAGCEAPEERAAGAEENKRKSAAGSWVAPSLPPACWSAEILRSGQKICLSPWRRENGFKRWQKWQWRGNQAWLPLQERTVVWSLIAVAKWTVCVVLGGGANSSSLNKILDFKNESFLFYKKPVSLSYCKDLLFFFMNAASFIDAKNVFSL